MFYVRNRLLYLSLEKSLTVVWIQGPVALEYVWDWPEIIPNKGQSLFIGIIGLPWDFVNIS